jgi:hypothetical protein
MVPAQYGVVRSVRDCIPIFNLAFRAGLGKSLFLGVKSLLSLMNLPDPASGAGFHKIMLDFQ